MTVRQSQTRQVAIAAADSIVVQPSDSRIGLVFYPTGAGYYAVDDQVLTSANVAILVNTNGGPVEFWKEKHGNVVAHEWHAFANGGAMTIAILEVFD